MSVWIITTLMGVGGIYYILWMLKKELPKRDKRIKEEWLAQEKNKKKINEHNSKEDLKIQEIANQEKQRILKENKKKIYVDNMRKGRDYEIFIIDYFRKRGYQTKGHGLLNGKKDKGIDIIIKKDKEITLIQCKNWKENSSYKIKHSHLKEFLGNTTAFLENNKEKAEGYIIKRLYITSYDVLDNSARHFLKDNSIVEHAIIQMKH